MEEPIDRAEALRMLHDLVVRLVADGYSPREIEAMLQAVMDGLRDQRILDEHARFSPALRYLQADADQS